MKFGLTHDAWILIGKAQAQELKLRLCLGSIKNQAHATSIQNQRHQRESFKKAFRQKLSKRNEL